MPGDATGAFASRTTDLQPVAREAPPHEHIRFTADPVGDGAVIAISGGFAILSGVIIGTGEITPQQIRPGFDTDALFWLDRRAVTQTVDDNAAFRSNLGLWGSLGFAVIDPILSGYRENSREVALVDAFLYGESLALTFGVTNLAKIAIRRPRPSAYTDAALHKNDAVPWNNTKTDSALSFFSGHASTTASVAATATYLAFARSPNTARPWITLVLGTAVTTWVSLERVRAGAHFPTDVVAGMLAGAGIGALVPHLHREDSAKQRPVWIGFSPAAVEGGTVTLSGLFLALYANCPSERPHENSMAHTLSSTCSTRTEAPPRGSNVASASSADA
jgi:membrane-associated phospholipid phosphatase